jgi:hypothetical protein
MRTNKYNRAYKTYKATYTTYTMACNTYKIRRIYLRVDSYSATLQKLQQLPKECHLAWKEGRGSARKIIGGYSWWVSAAWYGVNPGMVWKCSGVSIKAKAYRFNSERVRYFPKKHEWIRPALRASGLRRQRQWGVPTSIEVRHNSKKR